MMRKVRLPPGGTYLAATTLGRAYVTTRASSPLTLIIAFRPGLIKQAFKFNRLA